MDSRTFAALMLAVLVLCVGCRSGEQSSEDLDEEFHQKWAAMQETERFKDAQLLFEQCLHTAGYTETDPAVGVVLKDGTLHKPELGQSFEYSGAYLEYRVDTERCSRESGVDAIRQEFGTADPTPNANLIRAMNKYGTQQASCLANKGWQMPDPVTVKGALIWDVRLESEEKRQAYYRDQIACNMELFGGPGFPN